MHPLIKTAAKKCRPNLNSLDFPVEQLTENILALSDVAVIVTNGEAIDYCSDSIVSVLGIAREKVVNDGWDCLTTLIHPADIRLLKKKLVPEIRTHFSHLSEIERQRRIFNFTMRMRVSEHAYALIAVENKPLLWRRKDWPTVYASVLRDISLFGNKGEMTLNIYEASAQRAFYNVFERRYSFASEKFSGREAEIIRHIAGGLTSNQIASMLSLSPDTVRNHRKNILRKAGCRTSSALTSLALQEGII